MNLSGHSDRRSRPDNGCDVNREKDEMKTCLVVDDSAVAREIARRIVEETGFRIIEAEHGEQALAACEDVGLIRLPSLDIV